MNTAAAAFADDAPHLLVVDDDRRIRNLLSRFLVAEGYRVTTAETAAGARAKLEGLNFDLLILDVMMPGETGFELARHLRSGSNVPIIMLTARDESKSRIEGLTIGADDYVGKPFEPRELSLRIASILRRARPGVAPLVGIVRVGGVYFHNPRGGLKRRGGGVSVYGVVNAARRAGGGGGAPPRRAKPSGAARGPAGAARAGSAGWTCRSIGCAARSSAIPPIRCWCRRCAASAIGW